MNSLEGLPKNDLVEIHNNLNNWIWDDRLGLKPLHFEEMPNRDSKSRFCKYQTITPYMREIEKRTTEKERLKYHHLHNLKRNWLQFQVWWLKRCFRTKVLGYRL